jgi:hypothetical protein
MFRRVVRALIILVCIGLFVTILGFVSYRASTDCGLRDCRGGLSGIVGLAMKQYTMKYSSLPPAYVAGPDHLPAHSWRVLILPYLAQFTQFREQYRFDEPWNGPNNANLYDTTNEFYHCPTDPGREIETSYVAVIGPKTVFPGARAMPVSEITDPANTIFVVETSNSGIHWLEPRDISIDDALRGINKRPGPSISSFHVDFFYRSLNNAFVAFGDGEVRSVNNEVIDRKVLEQLLEAKGEKPHWKK